ncbi:class I fructose-bisphosphate aldolase [Sulfurirhabdus autotrophica]|uniref:Probable fructose-bisphosphate aldolase class 1 n=1 Tax=Sulfurirhabdus autotrophica TaxID=1706046 RepID=A0A4V2W215_9PROT|nr:class I fructose-bisphosphate aldolase [Sulfurirhabdus autotrophica]TCV86369.1 fructose-bisphosphate aldolase [Sulfurirhabdus autotrophica]
MQVSAMEQTILDLTAPAKGILAADESTGTMEKRLKNVGVQSTKETRRSYRESLFTSPGLNNYISGVILFEETLNQRSESDVPLPQLLSAQGIVPGIKVDKGTQALSNFPGDKWTQGLDGLSERLAGYKELGACFAKWRAVFTIGDGIPSYPVISVNAESLARYAAICQSLDIVPIVEPEVLMDGNHTIERCASVTEQVLETVFHCLHKHRVVLEHMLLKPNMVLPGKDCSQQATPEEIAVATLRCFCRTIPVAVPGINFLSGGQSDEAATANLNAINVCAGQKPWQLSFSYGRALQAPALKAWHGEAANQKAGQQALLKRARLNSLARQGKYHTNMENE